MKHCHELNNNVSTTSALSAAVLLVSLISSSAFTSPTSSLTSSSCGGVGKTHQPVAFASVTRSSCNGARGAGVNRETGPLFSDRYGSDEDPNYWSSSNDPSYEDQEDWQEMLAKRNQASSWSAFEPSEEGDEDTGDVGMITEDSDDLVDDTEAWLDVLSSITADEINFMNTEADRADKVRRMQEFGLNKDAISNTLGVAVDETLEKDEDNEVMEKFKEVTAESGFGMYLEEDIDLEAVESHSTVEIDDETGDPVRSQMVYVDEHTCIGCTNCAMIAQSTFFMESTNGRARVFDQWGDDDETIQIAIETCPVDCIHYVPYDELKRLEVERRDQNINFKARLVNQGEYGGGVAHRVGGSTQFTGPQKISGNMGSRCNNCPSRGCKNCPMYGVGQNPNFEAKEKKRKEKIAQKRMKEEMERRNKSAEL